MSQTRNPKRAGHPWNTPKGSTYSDVKALYLDPATGHVETASATSYNTEAELEAFRAQFPQTSAEERNHKVIQVLIARQRAHARVEWHVTSGPVDPTIRQQTPAEQIAILRRLTLEELRKLEGENR